MKAYIRGAIETEGNYRIEVKADPGAAHVQKSNIFKVKHENVATDAQLNSDNAITGLKIDGLPAGYYDITATTAAGGAVVPAYTSTATIAPTSGNTSNLAETLRVTLTGKNKTTGVTVSNTVNISVPAEATTQKDITDLLINYYDGKTITMGSGNNATTFTLKAEADENNNCVITSTSPNGELSSVSFVESGSTTTVSNISNSPAANTIYDVSVTGRATAANGSNGITITVTDGSYSGTYTVPGITSNMTADEITTRLQNIAGTTLTLTDGGGNTRDVTLKGEAAPNADGFYKLSASGGANSNFKITLSPSDIFTNATPQRNDSTSYALRVVAHTCI